MCEPIKKTEIIAGFPGVGKSLLACRGLRDKLILEVDVSKFERYDYPLNYITYIKKHIGVVDILLVSTNKEIIDALIAEKIHFTVVHPERCAKPFYLKRYKDRGDSDEFIKYMNDNWDAMLDIIMDNDAYLQTKSFDLIHLIAPEATLWNLMASPWEMNAYSKDRITSYKSGFDPEQDNWSNSGDTYPGYRSARCDWDAATEIELQEE